MTHQQQFEPHPARPVPRRRHLAALTAVALVGAAAVVALPAQAEVSPEVVGPDDPREGWQLLVQEDFTAPLTADEAPWTIDPHGDDSPWHVDTFDDDGQFFVNQGGEDFQTQLESFDLLRKSVSFGEGDWLTAEYAARDYDDDGEPDAPPSLTNTTLADGTTAAYLDEPSHDTGLIIRSTDALPSEYRIEYRLKDLNFGGQRDGEWDYDGLINGYSPEGCKRNFPWKRGGDFSGEPGPCNENFSDVRSANGYYFLSIMDYANPAPRNNVFIHTHRKVGMDLYTVSGGEGENYSACNPATGELYRQNSAEATGNGINAIFFRGDEFRDPSIAYNEFRMETECGSYDGSGAGTSIVSTAEIRPEIMPDEDYLFAIERSETGYTMEMSGNFLHLGEATLRYTRDFIQDGEPIWHFNNTPEQYDGSFDQSLEFTGPHGEYTIDHTWPAGSAYPDYFILGDPHTNYYEGDATIADIRLYVPQEPAVTHALAPAEPTGSADWYLDPVTVSLTAEAAADGSVLETAIDGEDYAPYTEPLEISDDGEHAVAYRLTAGEGVLDDGVAEFRIDSSPPVTDAEVTEGDGGEGSVVDFVAADATSGVQATQYRLGAGDWLGWDGEPLLLADPGTHELEYRSVDVAGNVEGAQIVTVEVAEADPTPTPTPSPEAPDEPGSPAPGAGEGGQLPDTGATVLPFAAGLVLLIAAGTALVRYRATGLGHAE